MKYARWTGSETVDSAGNVGKYTSIALDSNNRPHISYYDYTNYDLKYARWTGSEWEITTVDSEGIVGKYTSIALDSNDNPHISYYYAAKGDLKYARWTVETKWITQIVDSAGDVGKYTSIALDSNNQPHISYYDWSNYDLRYAATENRPPTAEADGPYTGAEGEQITFDASGSYDPDDDQLTYSWDFGDGTTGTGVFPEHAYAKEGTYTVTLNVTDSMGAMDTDTATVTITDAEPTADFSATPTSGVKPLTVQFKDKSTSHDGITGWDWDFNNDGEIDSNDQNPEYTYEKAGKYTVTLTIHEADGDSNTETKEDYITVKAAITIDQSGSDALVTATLDEESYTLSASFEWEKDSLHFISVPSTIDDPATAGKRYVFTQWSGLSSSTSNTIILKVTASGTLTANYKTQYYINVISDHGSPTPSQWVDEGSSLTVSVTSPAEIVPGQTRRNCTGYSIDGGQTQPGTSYTFEAVQAAHEIKFYWVQQFWLQVETAISGSTVEGTGWYDAGTSASISATTPYQPSLTHQFVFTLWTSTGTNEAPINDPTSHTTTVTMNNYYTVQANWQEQWYITVTSPRDEPIPSQWVNTGESLTVSVTSPADDDGVGTRYRCTGYRIDEGDLQEGTSHTFENVQVAHEITFEWTAQYYLTVGSAYATPGGAGWYDSGLTAYATMDTDTVSGGTGIQYVFTHWSGDTSGINYAQSDPIIMDAPKTATANWKTQYHLTVNTDPTGLSPQPSVSPYGLWHDEGTEVTLTAQNVSGYIFDHWTVEETSQGSGVNPITVTMDTPKTATAHYVTAPAAPVFPWEWLAIGIVIAVAAITTLFIRRKSLRARTPK